MCTDSMLCVGIKFSMSWVLSVLQVSHIASLLHHPPLLQLHCCKSHSTSHTIVNWIPISDIWEWFSCDICPYPHLARKQVLACMVWANNYSRGWPGTQLPLPVTRSTHGKNARLNLVPTLAHYPNASVTYNKVVLLLIFFPQSNSTQDRSELYQCRAVCHRSPLFFFLL